MRAAKIAWLENEREGLPSRTYKAGLDEDWQLEDEFKERYKNLGPAIAGLRERASELEAEVVALAGKNPAVSGGLVYDAQIAAYTPVRDAYGEGAEPLIEIEREVSRLLRDAIDPLTAGMRYWGQTCQGIRDQRTNDPEVRQARIQKQARQAEARAKVRF